MRDRCGNGDAQARSRRSGRGQGLRCAVVQDALPAPAVLCSSTARRRSAWCAAGVLFLALAGSPCAAQSHDGSDGRETAGIERDLGSGGDERTLVIPDGYVVDFDIVQLRGFAEVSILGSSAGQVVRSEAGVGGRVRGTLGGGAAQTLVLRIVPRKQASARVAISVTPAYPAAGQDLTRAAAFRAYVEAETLRRDHYRETVIAARTPAIDASVRSAYDTATELYGSAGDGCGQRQALVGRARMEVSAGSYDRARELLDRALAASCGDDPAEQAQAYKTIGMAAAYQGDYASSISAALDAARRYRALGDRYFEGVVLGNAASVYTEMGATTLALGAAEGSLAAATETGDRSGVVYARKALAGVHLARGELAAALESYRNVFALLRDTPYPMIEGETWNDVGVVYHQMGDYRGAIASFRRAEAIWTRMRYDAGLVDTRMNHAAVILEQGDAAAAERILRRALRLARDKGLKSAESRVLRSLGIAQLRRGRRTEAQRCLVDALALARATSAAADEAYAHRALGDAALDRRDVDTAAREYRQALEIIVRLGNLDAELAARQGLARVLLEAGDPAAGVAQSTRALEIIDLEHGAIFDPSLRRSYHQLARSVYDVHIEGLMRLHELHPAERYDRRALAAVERARAEVQRDRTIERSLRTDPRADPALRAAEREAAERLRIAALALARLPPTATADMRRAHEAAVDASHRDLENARGLLLASDPGSMDVATDGPGGVAPESSVDPGSAVIEFWLGARVSYRWTVTAGGVRARRIAPRERIEAAALNLRGALQRQSGAAPTPFRDRAPASPPDAPRTAARALGDLLALRSDLPERTRSVAVVADGSLELVPLGYVFDELRGAREPLEGLSSLPALSALRAIRHAQGHSRLDTAVVFADPLMAAPRALSARGLDEARDPIDLSSLGPLPHSRREAEAIAALGAPGRVQLVLGADATRSAVIGTDWSRYGIVHFATHALVDLDRPDLSGVVLSLVDAEGRPTDGFLRVNDIYALRLSAGLVVLSACETARGRPTGSEGVFSLARAFFYAGTPRVIASLWAVDDRATALLMQEFYRALWVEHRTVSGALRQAQERLRSQARFREPYYWAGFVLQGDWR